MAVRVYGFLQNLKPDNQHSQPTPTGAELPGWVQSDQQVLFLVWVLVPPPAGGSAPTGSSCRSDERERCRISTVGRKVGGGGTSAAGGVKWGGTSAAEGAGIVPFPWSTTPFTLSPPRAPLPPAALARKAGVRLSFRLEGPQVLTEMIQMKKFNTMDGLAPLAPPPSAQVL